MNPLRNKLSQIATAVIAGGKSSRFGSPKTEARFLDKPLLDYAVQLGYRITSDVFVVTVPQIAYSNMFAPKVYDFVSDCGPLGGIYTALAYSKWCHVCTVPCDMPLLNSDVYQTLYRYIDHDRPVVAVSDHGLEPLVAIWPTNTLGTVNQAISNKQFSLRKVLSELQAKEVYLPDIMEGYHTDLFVNINHKEDLGKLNQLNKAI